jgi:hypothetical protein
MILVAGGTGTLGAKIVSLLAERGQHVRVLARDRSRAQHLGARVETVEGDVASAAALRRGNRGGAHRCLGDPGLRRNTESQPSEYRPRRQRQPHPGLTSCRNRAPDPRLGQGRLAQPPHGADEDEARRRAATQGQRAGVDDHPAVGIHGDLVPGARPPTAGQRQNQSFRPRRKPHQLGIGLGRGPFVDLAATDPAMRAA